MSRFQFESMDCLVSGNQKGRYLYDNAYDDSETVKFTSYKGLGRDSMARGIVQRC